jgi:hypothetical protein
VQGRTEGFLLNLPADSGIKATILRPGYFFPDKELAQNSRPLTQRLLSKVLVPAMSSLKPDLYIPIRDLSGFAVNAAKGMWDKEGTSVFSNPRMRELMGTGCHNDKAKGEL